MSNTLKVATWNIAGGHTIASLEHFDYEEENLSYFVDELRKVDADIICLQEAHTPLDGTKSNAAIIAEQLGFQYVFNSPASESHVSDTHRLGNAILSKESWVEAKEIFFANPSVPLKWKDGRPAGTHEKNLQVVYFKHFSVANNQMLPLRLFGLSYDDDSFGGELAENINKTMSQEVRNPVIWCGDFNVDNPLNIYTHLQKLSLKESLSKESTRPTLDGVKSAPDHILYAEPIVHISSEIIHTNTDHYLCVSEFDVSSLA